MRAIETGHHRGHQAAILCTTEYFRTVFRRESILTGLVPSARRSLGPFRTPTAQSVVFLVERLDNQLQFSQI